jgi:hypothetical protein
MTNDHDFDTQLKEQFDKVRRADVHAAPAFGAMLARARAQAVQTQPAAGATPIRSARRWRPSRLVAWGGPVLVAAGLGALWVIPERLKDREFDRVVTEWAETEATLRSPTDGLLTVPGSEFLTLPSLGGSAARRGL